MISYTWEAIRGKVIHGSNQRSSLEKKVAVTDRALKKRANNTRVLSSEPVLQTQSEVSD